MTWSFSRVHSQHYIALSLMALGAVITLVRKPGPGDNGVAAPRAAGAPGMAPRSAPACPRCGCAVEPSARFCEYCGQKR
ncbi:zinc ribbon domain-containing protein [Humidesulfovibrio mexicanus]|uniref:zinc ribbon domain-containing protein n=1 Tax=Humidesulfovibrio mexicanus TaxID=147047 RepID=UPI0011783EC1|nr:zinc ribbon domain-containing protein [Humidesulfovibrio mexicanus]